MKRRIQLLKWVLGNLKWSQNKARKNIAYLGWIGQGNLGDEAMFSAFKKLFPCYNVYPYNWLRGFKKIKNIILPKYFDAIVLGGGTLINSVGSFKNFQMIFDQFPKGKKITFGS